MSIKRILVPLDGSKNSERGIEMAVDLAMANYLMQNKID